MKVSLFLAILIYRDPNLCYCSIFSCHTLCRVVGDLVTLLVLCKGLPQAYNRDLQEDKEPLFDSVKTIIGMLEVSTKFAQNITFNRERIQRALPAGHLDATTVADYLVNKACCSKFSDTKD
ncbi:argininosuccinate lyase, chloroplastic-like [Papaver somniferum]|uniref:argininosuccinate lyase, chloroplastic-like n=1 Tax=Papaver somniferum TaxID=3469 RepID=UPI000E6FB9A7|nr:argininosuccinate lyase, chloroplastic-like [Papaver somniferum]